MGARSRRTAAPNRAPSIRALVKAVRERTARAPLRWRLALGYALVLLLVLAPIAALQAATIHNQLYGDASTALAASLQAETAAPRAGGKHALNRATPSPGAIAQRAARRQGVDAAVVVDAAGRALSSADPTGAVVAEAARLVDKAAIARLEGGQTSVPPYQVATSRGAYLVDVAPLANPPPRNPVVGGPPRSSDPPPPVAAQGSREYLALARSLAPIDRTTTYVWTLTLAGTALALLVATALGTLLVRRALRPLTRVAGAANAIAAGDYAHRVDVPPARDEVGHLAVAFNTMAGAVEDAFATQRRFVADAAHELRTPLTALSGYADVLLLGAADDPRELASALEAMRGETRRMTRLVNDLLALARLEGGGLTAPSRDVDLAALLCEAGTGVRLLRADRRVTLDIPDTPVIVRGDADRLRQVVSNLLDNAVKFTEPGGRIGLRLRTTARVAVIEVCDDGIGIAPEDLPHIMERFYRADKARSRSTGAGGTGLGLSIVQAIVAAHGGSLSVVSRPHEGTTITARLPRACGG